MNTDQCPATHEGTLLDLREHPALHRSSDAREVLRDLSEESKVHGFVELADQAAQLRRDLDEPFFLMVVGEGKFGKSSLINALVGRKVAEVGVLPKTWTVDVFRRSGGGRERAELIFSADRDRPVAKALDDARKYCEQQQIAAHECQKAAQPWKSDLFQVSWFYDLPWPAQDIAIVDTPGFAQLRSDVEAKVEKLFGSEGIECELTEAFEHYYDRADVVLWCLKATKLEDEDTRRVMSCVAGYEKKIIGLITLYDKIPADKRMEVMERARKLYGDVISEFHFMAAGAKDEELRDETVESLRHLLDEEIIPNREALKHDADRKSIDRIRYELVSKVDAITDMQISNLLLMKEKLQRVEMIATALSTDLDAQISSVWQNIETEANRIIPSLWEKAASTSNPAQTFRTLIQTRTVNWRKAQDDLTRIQNQIFSRASLEATNILMDLKWRGVRIRSHGAEKTSTIAVVEGIERAGLGTVGAIAPTLTGSEGRDIALGAGIGVAVLFGVPLAAIGCGPLVVVAGAIYYALMKNMQRVSSIKAATAQMSRFCQMNSAKSKEDIWQTVRSYVEQVTLYIERSFVRHNGVPIEQIVSRAHKSDRTLNVLNAWPTQRTTSRNPHRDAAGNQEISTYFLALLPAVPTDAAAWDKSTSATLGRYCTDAGLFTKRAITKLTKSRSESIDTGNLEDPDMRQLRRLRDLIAPQSLRDFKGVSHRELELMEMTRYSSGETVLSRFSDFYCSLIDTINIDLDRCTCDLQARWNEKAKAVLQEKLTKAIERELPSPAPRLVEADESRIEQDTSDIYQAVIASKTERSRFYISGENILSRSRGLLDVLRERAPDPAKVVRVLDAAGAQCVHLHGSQSVKQRLDELATRLAVLPALIIAGHPGFAVETGRLVSTSWQQQIGAWCAAGTLFLGLFVGICITCINMCSRETNSGGSAKIIVFFMLTLFAFISWQIGARVARTIEKKRLRAAVRAGLEKLAVDGIAEIHHGVVQVVSQWIAESQLMPVEPTQHGHKVFDATALVPQFPRPMIRALPAFAGIASFLVLSGVSLGIYSMKGGQVWEPSSPAPHHESVNTAPEGSFRPWRPYNQETSPEREPPVSPVHAPSVPYTGGFARSDHSGSPAVESNRAASDAHIKRGRASYRAGATGEAIAAFRMATASDPSNAQAHMWLSNAFIRDSQFVEAEAEARSGLSLADSAEQQGAALHNICRALEGQGRLDEALRSCERSLSVRPDNLDTNNTIDRIRARQPGAPPATSGEESTVTDCRVHIERGIEANRAEDREAAITAFQQAVECSEENPGAHLFLSNALIVAERYSEGADAARRALTLAESSEQRGAAYNNICRAMEGMDRIDEAIWNCERSLRVRPGNEAVQRRLERLREGLR